MLAPLTEVDDTNAQFLSEEAIFNKVLFDKVLSALTELTPSQRLMFLLRHYEGMSYEEIATAMNCSTGTAKKAVWRALAKLRAKLELSNERSDERLAHLAAEY
jgi:RNA polymerase sigma-70 factor (ECF subfamily)